MKFLGWTTSGWGAKCPNEAGSSSLVLQRHERIQWSVKFKLND